MLQAFRGDVGDEDSRPLVKAALATTISSQQEAQQENNKDFKFQKCLSENLLLRLYPDDLPELVMRRIASHFPALKARLSLESFVDIRNLVLTFPSPVCMAIIRTWSNAWITSRRLASAGCVASCCVFGYPDFPDDLEHYMSCDVLWSEMSLPFPRCFTA